MPATVRHFVPVVKPAPPRPRRPEASTSSMMPSGPSRRATVRPRPPPRSSQSSRSRQGWVSRTRSIGLLVAIAGHLPVRPLPESEGGVALEEGGHVLAGHGHGGAVVAIPEAGGDSLGG